jgi:DNA repair exonuclease SbcCD ATPase subunit
MLGQPSGSVLTATLRIPASEYAAALTELKSVGNLEHDEEAADEIAERHGDLEARLQNAQNAERRLQQLLKERSDKVVSVPSIKQQLSELHNEIERMGAERRSYDSRVVFSNVFFSLKEEKTAPAETLGEQIRGAGSTGLSDALHSLSGILLFFASYGPSLLLWVGILFIPGRFAWRRWKQTAAVI